MREDASSQDRCSDVDETGLFLWMNADVVAIDVVGRNLRNAALQRKRKPPLDRLQRPFRCPSMAQEEVFETGAVAVLAQDIGVAKDLGHGAQRRHDLAPADEGVDSLREMRFRR